KVTARKLLVRGFESFQGRGFIVSRLWWWWRRGRPFKHQLCFRGRNVLLYRTLAGPGAWRNLRCFLSYNRNCFRDFFGRSPVRPGFGFGDFRFSRFVSASLARWRTFGGRLKPSRFGHG